MNLHAVLFYLVSALIIGATAMAVTRRHMVHAVLFLVISFFGSALLFYLLGAPLLAALEVIVYAGAIMVLFLFVVMMMRIEPSDDFQEPIRKRLAAGGVGFLFLMLCALIVSRAGDAARMPMQARMVEPAAFGYFLFDSMWTADEIASLLLLVALVGVLHLGIGRGRRRTAGEEDG